MDAMIKLYAQYKETVEKQSMGFKMSGWDQKLLKYGAEFEKNMMDLSVNITLEDALDLGWKILAVTTMPGDDVTHPVPDNTGYITEGQFYLKNGRIEPFGSLSRLKQQVNKGVDPDKPDQRSYLMSKVLDGASEEITDKELLRKANTTRFDHRTLMDAMIKLYAQYKETVEKQSMGFKMSAWDQKLLKYGAEFEEKMMDLSVNIELIDALDLGWKILADNFEKGEVGIPSKLTDRFWPKN
jgi:V/A-type H+-transporting ATPase subunit B